MSSTVATQRGGFPAGNEFSSEAVEGALPLDQNNPKVLCFEEPVFIANLALYHLQASRMRSLQVCAFGLYAEQLSGTAFTAPRRYLCDNVQLCLLFVCWRQREEQRKKAGSKKIRYWQNACDAAAGRA